jgi:hypothetical protein
MKENLCWPQEGVKLFISDGEYYEHAHFGWSHFSVTSAGYCMGYKDSADTLIDEAIKSKNIRKLDTFIFPILFLYRQYLEWQMKSIYLKYSEETKEIKQKIIGKCGHSLIKIWNIIRPIMENEASDKDRKTTKIVEKYIQQYHEFDTKSTKYRYPINQNLEEVHTEEQRINYNNLKERMNELQSFFTGVVGHLESLEDYKTGMESNDV